MNLILLSLVCIVNWSPLSANREQSWNTVFLGKIKEVKSEGNEWTVKTSNNNKFIAPNIIIAGGVGSFEPRKLTVEDTEKFEGKSIFYSVKDKEKFKNKLIL